MGEIEVTDFKPKVFQIPQVQFAVASDSNYTFSGILGLGYAYPYSINYPSVLNLMVSRKLILAPIFSLGLGGDGDGFSKRRYRSNHSRLIPL
jgi:hypothetical protein